MEDNFDEAKVLEKISALYESGASYDEAELDKYLKYFENYDISLEQKREKIRIISVIMEAFVDLAWEK